jgi:hypothetical protein
MRSFEDYFTVESIVAELCKMRVRGAAKQNEAQFLDRITKGPTRTRRPDRELLDMLPPRQEWHRNRPRLAERPRGDPSSVSFEAIIQTWRRHRRTKSSAPWFVNLCVRANSIRNRVLSADRFQYGPLTIVAVPKDLRKHPYRPLALLQLDDRIVDGLTARYFRETLDAALLPSCLAFRCSRGTQPPPTIHDALDAVLEEIDRHRDEPLFAAECDIQGFYDCVSHDVARTSIQELLQEAKKKDASVELDPRALHIFEAYLGAYCFTKDVKDRALAELHAKRDPRGDFKWPLRDLEALYEPNPVPDVGVPQGAALSCVVANAVLHLADKEMAAVRNHGGVDLKYLRYCDDMIILSPDKRMCDEALERYCSVLKKLRLPVHSPSDVGIYAGQMKKAHWDGKSRKPYLWGNPEVHGVPWVQFVGYQVRRDGLVRVRANSLKKERKKLTDTANELLRVLEPHSGSDGNEARSHTIRRTAHQIRHRLRMRLISMAVGRRTLVHGPGKIMPMCWGHGFRGLLGKRFCTNWLKALDRHRERQIARVWRRARVVAPPKAEVKRGELHKALKYYGAPFSYLFQFQTTKFTASASEDTPNSPSVLEAKAAG